MTEERPVLRTTEEIQEWLVQRLAERLNWPLESVDVDVPLPALGIDSMQFVVLVGELEDWLSCRFAGNPLAHYRTIAALSEFIARELAAGNHVLDPNAPSVTP